MSNLNINDKLNITYPDTFHVMDEAEKKNLQTMTDEDFTGLSNHDDHIIITIGAKEIPGFSNLVLSTKVLIKNMEKQVGKAMMINSYARGRFKDREIDGVKACGFDYSNEVQGIVMMGESYVVKKDKTVYTFNMYSRDNLRAKNMKTWEEMLGSIRWI